MNYQLVELLKNTVILRNGSGKPGKIGLYPDVKNDFRQ